MKSKYIKIINAILFILITITLSEQLSAAANLTSAQATSALFKILKNEEKIPSEDAVRKLIAQGADISAKDENRDTPFAIAKRNNYKSIIDLLEAEEWKKLEETIEASSNKTIDLAEKEKKEDANNTLLDLITEENLTKDNLTKLISNGANVNARYQFNMTPLHWAARGFDANIVELLITYGADVNNKDADNNTPLMTAVSEENIDAVKILIANEAELNVKNSENDTAFSIALESDNNDLKTIIATAELLELTKLGKLTKEDLTKLITAYANIDAKNKFGMTPLHIAADGGYNKIVELLLKENANINALEDNNNYTPLMIAVEKNNPSLVQYFIDEGADLNLQDNEGNTALHIAFENGYNEIADKLIAQKANQNILNSNKQTAEDIKKSKEQKSTTSKSPELKTQIKEAASKFFILLNNSEKIPQLSDLVKFINANAFNINFKDTNDDTPLLIYVKKNEPKIVKLLIDAGADPTSKNKSGFTPLQIAEKNNFKDIIAILKSEEDKKTSSKTVVASSNKNIKENLQNLLFFTQTLQPKLK